MAEGLIQQPKNKQLEDLGCEYFRDLLLRSIFQHSNINSSKFIMHDLVNDLAKWISRETSFILEDELDIVLQSNSLERIRHSSYTRRKYEVENKFEVFHRLENLRTFLPLWFRDDQTYITNTVFSNLFLKLKKLRILSLANYYITEVPNSIEGLRHLRYLDLSHTRIRRLPESTSSLFNLQILMLRRCSRLMKLPTNMRNLINLRYLDISGADLIREMPLGMRKLKYLLKLSNFIVGKGVGSCLEDLKDLKFLREKLCISNLENVINCKDPREMILSDKKDLEVLVLEWSSSFNHSRDGVVEKNVLDILQPHRNLKELTINNYGGQKFSSWIGDPSFSNILVLTLDGCENCTTLPPLGILSSLKSLTIRMAKMLKKIGSEIYGEGCSKPFQSLETLCFENLLEWEYWDPLEENEHVERFPRLQELSISRCPKLCGRLPNHLPLLETLTIENCEQLVVSFSSLPMLNFLEISRCKGMVCNSPTDSVSLNSMTRGKSNFPVFKYWSKQVFQKIEILIIWDCEELIHLWPNETCLEKPPQWSHSFTSLKELYMMQLPNLVSFPDGFLSILSKVDISECNALTSLHEGLQHNNARLQYLVVGYCACLTIIVRGRLPSSLKGLSVDACENLVCVVDDGEDTEKVDNSSTSLHLEIRRCHSLMRLTSSGQLPSTLGRLTILDCLNLRTIGQLPKALVSLDIQECPMLESIVESFDGNTSLEYIRIRICDNLKSIPEGLHTLGRLACIDIWDCPSLVLLPKDGLPNTDLEVHIRECEKLQALPSRMHSLKSLQQLTISSCPSIAFFPAEDFPTNLTSLKVEGPNIYKSLTEWGLHKLTSLRKLTIGKSPNVESFPEEEMGMILPTSLIALRLRSFPKLKYLSSKGFQNLTSLESLNIKQCPNLTSLPDFPSSLLQLYIRRCPLLKKRCKRNEGQEWSKIAHIPCVYIHEKFVYDPKEEE